VRDCWVRVRTGESGRNAARSPLTATNGHSSGRTVTPEVAGSSPVAPALEPPGNRRFSVSKRSHRLAEHGVWQVNWQVERPISFESAVTDALSEPLNLHDEDGRGDHDDDRGEVRGDEHSDQCAPHTCAAGPGRPSKMRTPSRWRFRRLPPVTFRSGPCGLPRPTSRSNFDLLALRARCKGESTETPFRMQVGELLRRAQRAGSSGGGRPSERPAALS